MTIIPDHTAQSGPGERIVTALAAYAAANSDQPGRDLLVGALQTALRIARPDLPLPEVPATARRILGAAMDDLDAAGLLPLRQACHLTETSPCQHADERPNLADIAHTITVEPVTPELRRGTDLPEEATLVVVERHHGHLSKVCASSNDLTVAEYVEWGYDVTIEDLARGIASTYGATYIEAPAVTA